MTEPDAALPRSLAAANFGALVMRALGSEYEPAGSQLADRVLKVVEEYGGMAAKHPDSGQRAAAVGAAVTKTVEIVLSLLAAAVRARG